MIKAIFFDIDGTLVSFKTHKIPNSTKESIAKLKEKGIKLFIATGRVIGQINNLEDLVFDGYITANGFNCFIGDKEIYKQNIAPDEINSLMDYLKNEESFPCSIMTKEGTFINYIDNNVEEVSKSINLKIPVVDNYYDFVQEKINDILQINLFVDNNKEKEIVKKVFKNCDTSRWHPLFADVNVRGGGKHIGVDKIIEYYGIDISETMAFGDGGNDYTMIEHCGIGIAMGNANEHLKEVANYITDHIDDDGVYKALKKFNIL